MAVRARAARTGVYQYSGRDVDPENAHGLRDTAIVNVLRDEQTVFDTAAVHSFIGKPITDNHPTEAVTAQNWRDLSRGTIMGAMRDGGARMVRCEQGSAVALIRQARADGTNVCGLSRQGSKPPRGSQARRQA